MTGSNSTLVDTVSNVVTITTSIPPLKMAMIIPFQRQRQCFPGSNSQHVVELRFEPRQQGVQQLRAGRWLRSRKPAWEKASCGRT